MVWKHWLAGGVVLTIGGLGCAQDFDGLFTGGAGANPDSGTATCTSGQCTCGGSSGGSCVCTGGDCVVRCSLTTGCALKCEAAATSCILRCDNSAPGNCALTCGDGGLSTKPCGGDNVAGFACGSPHCDT